MNGISEKDQAIIDLEYVRKALDAAMTANEWLRDECDELKAESETLKHKIAAGSARESDLRSQVRAGKESRARVVESNKSLRKDAERYRWFRDCGAEWNGVMILDSHDRLICEELDDRIDSAMSKEP